VTDQKSDEKKNTAAFSQEAGETLRRAYEGVDMSEVYRKKPALYKAVKRFADILISVSALVLLSPVMLITAIAIKLEDGGPVFFNGRRLGKDMKCFSMHKFRSMCVDAESMTKEVLKDEDKIGLAFKIKDDPRVTRVGRFIRHRYIDEIPQFINVLEGSMSLVGPRPIQTTEKEIEDYEKQRWIVKPGITCIWQVYGCADTPWDEWVEMDLKYISEMSFLTDLKLLFATVGAVFRGTV